MSRSTREVFEDHLKKRKDGDLESDIATNYAPDVMLLTGTGIFIGHEGVRRSAEELEIYLGGDNFTFTNQLVKGDYAFLEWDGRNNEKHVCDGADSFVIKEGRIVMQSIHYTVQKET